MSAANRAVSKPQAAIGIVLAVGVMSFLLWGATAVRSRANHAPKPVEIRPVQEDVVAGERPQTAAPGVPMTQEQALRREALENMKFGLKNGH